MTFDEWCKSDYPFSIFWVIESEMQMRTGLIPCGGCVSYQYNQRANFQLCPFRPDFASPCIRNGEPGTPDLCTGRKPKAERQGDQRPATGSGNAQAPVTKEGGHGCLTDAKSLQLSFL